MIHQVRSIQDYANTHGMNATLAVMNNPEGMFAVPGLGLFAETAQGDILANPLAPEQVGTNILGMTNEYGMSLARDIISLANRGGGFAYSSFKENASTPERLNLVYVQPIDNAAFGAGKETGAYFLLEKARCPERDLYVPLKFR